MELVTKRLILRPLKNSDARSMFENLNDIEVSKWLGTVPYPYKLKDAKDWIKKSRKILKKRVKETYIFGIELKEEKKIIGGIEIGKINKFQKTAGVGYWLGRKYWNKKYGSEALDAVLDFAFKKLKLRRIDAEVFEGNISSCKLLEKFGAKREGLKRKYSKCKANKKIHNLYIYGILKEEYKSMN